MKEYRRIAERDRAEIESLLAGTQAFQPHEIAVAMELVDIALHQPAQQDYHPYVLTDGGAIVGYVCFGKNPMSRSTYDLYWIATKAAHARQGVGRELFRHAEEEIKRRGGRQIIIETSSKERYHGTREFYARIGCELAARLTDFYDEGDDQLIYRKRL